MPEPGGTLQIATEAPGDRAAVCALHAAAFDTDAEARLVDRLRAEARPYIGLVATVGATVVGHIAFSPVRAVAEDGRSTVRAVAEDGRSTQAMGLAPMAVLPAHQCRGIGSRLVRAGLAELAARDLDTVFVLGHPDYYPRFGFRRADADGWRFLPGTEHAFFVRGPVPPGPGTIRYHAAFGDLG